MANALRLKIVYAAYCVSHTVTGIAALVNIATEPGSRALHSRHRPARASAPASRESMTNDIASTAVLNSSTGGSMSILSLQTLVLLTVITGESPH